jgi:hypothetical protein
MEVKLVWGGWNTEGTSDKVWGVIQRCDAKRTTKYNDRVYVFWGARGKSLQFKNDLWAQELQDLTVKKERRKGYRQISYYKLLEIWPDFEETLSQKLTFHILSKE